MSATLNALHTEESDRDLIEYGQLANPSRLTTAERRGRLQAKCGNSIPSANAPVILCVDDEPVGLNTRALLLSIAGYTILATTSGSGALRLFRSNHVDLVITDHILPDLTGAELVRQMKYLRAETPIVLFTGLVDPPAGFEQADLVLMKGSVTPPEFLAAIATVLSRARSGLS